MSDSLFAIFCQPFMVIESVPIANNAEKKKLQLGILISHQALFFYQKYHVFASLLALVIYPGALESHASLHMTLVNSFYKIVVGG